MSTRSKFSFSQIPQALRDWRANLVGKWLKAKTQNDRDALIRSLPKPAIIRNTFGKLLPDATPHIQEAHAREIQDKQAEIAAMRQEITNAHARLSVLHAQAEASKARLLALTERRDRLIRENSTLPERARALVTSLGFDLTHYEPTPNPTQKTT